MARYTIGTVCYRAKDALRDDIVLLRVHGAQRWYWLTKNASTDGQTTTLTYRSVIDSVDVTVDVGCWELLKTQFQKEDK